MIRACLQCGQHNRVPAARLTHPAKCGACKAQLAAPNSPLDVDAREFEQIVEHADVPILVDFWAAWCGPCRMAAPGVASVAREMAGRALVLKVDTERHPELAGRFQVRGIPHFVVLKDGRVIRQHSGLVQPSQLLSWLEAAR